MKNNTLNNLKSEYEKLKIKPSADLWDRLDQKLDEKPENASKQSSGWWKYAAIILLMISVGTIIYFKNKNNFDHQKTDYIVKQRLENAANPINPEFEKQSVASEEQKNNQENTVKAVLKNPETNSAEVLNSKKEVKIQKISSPAIEEIAVTQQRTIDINPDKIKSENIIFPAIAEAKKTKSGYINADELLMGREFDKTREETKKDDRKFGVFNINKVFQKVDNVTVLGVTVYTDTK
ncbi:MAG: hypothetical protein JNN23_15370 [Chryseobacterium gambrini]|nr:hypothetical protein [Chryseobacterium gambrini]